MVLCWNAHSSRFAISFILMFVLSSLAPWSPHDGNKEFLALLVFFCVNVLWFNVCRFCLGVKGGLWLSLSLKIYSEPVWTIKDFADKNKLFTSKLLPHINAKQSVCQHLESTLRDTMTSLICNLWPFLNFSPTCWSFPQHSTAFSYQTSIFTDLSIRSIDVIEIHRCDEMAIPQATVSIELIFPASNPSLLYRWNALFLFSDFAKSETKKNFSTWEGLDYPAAWLT